MTISLSSRGSSAFRAGLRDEPQHCLTPGKSIQRVTSAIEFDIRKQSLDVAGHSIRSHYEHAIERVDILARDYTALDFFSAMGSAFAMVRA